MSRPRRRGSRSEIAKVDADIKRADAKLNNADFMARAKEEVVEGEREKREEAEGRRAKILEALERLKARPSHRLLRDLLSCYSCGKSGEGTAVGDEAKNVAVLKDAYARWHDSKGDSFKHWIGIVSDDIKFGSLAEGAEPLGFARKLQRPRGPSGVFCGAVGPVEMIHYTTNEYIAQAMRCSCGLHRVAQQEDRQDRRYTEGGLLALSQWRDR